MKILLASLIKRKVTPDIVASRPRMIFEIGKELASRGHDVSILGTKNSQIPNVKTIPVVDKSFVEMPKFENPFYAHLSYICSLSKKLEKIGNNFDIIHNHTMPELINLFVAEKLETPMVTTIHTQAIQPLDDALSLFKKTNLVSISKAHRKLFKKAKIKYTVLNGIDTEQFSYRENKSDYLLWLGRLAKAKDNSGKFMDPKGVRWAIRLARETNQKLILSGNIEDMDFYNKDVKPFLNDKIKWHGPLSSELKLSRDEVTSLMQNAKAFLMTINWYEPFGLVMAEAMATGTPVIAFNRGSVPEIVVNGKTGFVVEPSEGIDGLKTALQKIEKIEPKDCRIHVEKNFSTTEMVNNYISVYSDVLRNHTS